MATRQKPTFDDRVAEYVDSPMITQRLRYGKKISARIMGNFGVYRTFVSHVAQEINGDCTCPSEIFPCKHVHALRATWNRNPNSFFDLESWLGGLRKRSKDDLIESIGAMVVEAPHVLSLFGIEGFEEVADDGDAYYD
jgi:uncharacterized Zn finger protein